MATIGPSAGLKRDYPASLLARREGRVRARRGGNQPFLAEPTIVGVSAPAAS